MQPFPDHTWVKRQKKRKQLPLQEKCQWWRFPWPWWWPAERWGGLWLQDTPLWCSGSRSQSWSETPGSKGRLPSGSSPPLHRECDWKGGQTLEERNIMNYLNVLGTKVNSSVCFSLCFTHSHQTPHSPHPPQQTYLNSEAWWVKSNDLVVFSLDSGYYKSISKNFCNFCKRS